MGIRETWEWESHENERHMEDLERPSLSCLSPNCVSPIPLHVSLIPLSLLFPCLSYSYVSLTPMYLSLPCISYSHVSLIPLSLWFPCLSFSPVSLIPLSRSSICLSHSPVSLIPLSLSLLCSCSLRQLYINIVSPWLNGWHSDVSMFPWAAMMSRISFMEGRWYSISGQISLSRPWAALERPWAGSLRRSTSQGVSSWRL